MIDESTLERIRSFELIERLPAQVQDELLRRSATVLRFEPGQVVYVQGQVDNLISYLLTGRVERLVDGRVEASFETDSPASRRPLDGLAAKDHTLRVSTEATVLQMTRRELERSLREAYSETMLEVTEVASDTADDWYTQLLSSPLFSRLSAASIHSIFDRMEAIEVGAGEEVVRQGEDGDHYYVVQSGSAEVVRRPSNGRPEVQLATLGPGKGFGEDALVTGAPRNATVRMLEGGEVRRLAKSDFHELVLDALVQGVSIAQGRWLVEQGGQWIDARERASFNRGTLEDALNIPPHLLRTQAAKLDPSRIYVLCHDEPATSMLGAFLLCERGFDTAYLNEPVGPHASVSVPRPQITGAEDPTRSETMSEPKRPNGNGDGRGNGADGNGADANGNGDRATREELGGTMIGDQLADLLDEIDDHREELVTEAEPIIAGENGSPAPDDLNTMSDRPNGSANGSANGPANGAEGEEPEPAIGSGEREMSVGIDHTGQRMIAEAMRAYGELERTVSDDLQNQRETLRNLLQAHLDKLERAVKADMDARARSLEAHYEQHYAEKEQKLRAGYEQLTSLANRISQQKAEINKARKGLESMLQTASRVHREVFRAGSSLVEKLDHLGELGEDVGPH